MIYVTTIQTGQFDEGTDIIYVGIDIKIAEDILAEYRYEYAWVEMWENGKHSKTMAMR